MHAVVCVCTCADDRDVAMDSEDCQQGARRHRLRGDPIAADVLVGHAAGASVQAGCARVPVACLVACACVCVCVRPISEVRAALTELMNPAAIFSVLIGALTQSLVHIASRPLHTALHMLQRAWARYRECMQARRLRTAPSPASFAAPHPECFPFLCVVFVWCSCFSSLCPARVSCPRCVPRSLLHGSTVGLALVHADGCVGLFGCRRSRTL